MCRSILMMMLLFLAYIGLSIKVFALEETPEIKQFGEAANALRVDASLTTKDKIDKILILSENAADSVKAVAFLYAADLADKGGFSEEAKEYRNRLLNLDPKDLHVKTIQDATRNVIQRNDEGSKRIAVFFEHKDDTSDFTKRAISLVRSSKDKFLIRGTEYTGTEVALKMSAKLLIPDITPENKEDKYDKLLIICFTGTPYDRILRTGNMPYYHVDQNGKKTELFSWILKTIPMSEEEIEYAKARGYKSLMRGKEAELSFD